MDLQSRKITEFEATKKYFKTLGEIYRTRSLLDVIGHELYSNIVSIPSRICRFINRVSNDLDSLAHSPVWVFDKEFRRVVKEARLNAQNKRDEQRQQVYSLITNPNLEANFNSCRIFPLKRLNWPESPTFDR